MALTFYYAPMSTASLTDLILEELGVPCQRVKVDLKGGDQKKPEFLKLNPNGKVPVIVHDDIPIFESAAITMYLGEQFGVDKKLYPAPGPKRGEAMKWVVWANVTLGDAVYSWARHAQWLPEDHRNANAAAAGLKDVHSNLAILDGALKGNQYILGATFSLVDAHLVSYTDWLRHMKIDFSAYKSLNAWSERCAARPAYKKQMASEGM